MLNMDSLLDAHRRFVQADVGAISRVVDTAQGKRAVLIDPKDGSYRECEETLEVTSVDDYKMGVECTDCGEAYGLEYDAFDSATDYVLDYLVRRE